MRSKEGGFRKHESTNAAIETKLVSIYDSDNKNLKLSTFCSNFNSF